MIRLRILDILKEQNHSKYWLFKQMDLSYQNFNRMVQNETTSIKFENIEKLINQFNKELEDIKINNLEFSNITFAMDIFFDNIFTDISVQRQINDSIEDIERLE